VRPGFGCAIRHKKEKKNMSEIRLGDDGTLDTVLFCGECGEEFRFNFASSDDSAEGDAAYDAFLDECVAEVEDEHECEADEIEEPSSCSVCGGESQVLGQLGNVTHYRCRNCGMDSMSPVYEVRG
jgi:hypothetical protein